MLRNISNRLARRHSESVVLIAAPNADEVQMWLMGNAEQMRVLRSVIQVRQRGKGKSRNCNRHWKTCGVLLGPTHDSYRDSFFC